MKKTMRVGAVAAATIGMILASTQLARAAGDPDDLDEATLLADLMAELDDVTELPATADELEKEFVTALHDEGDSTDPKENAISWAQLEHEMEEAGTTVEAEVHKAMAKAWADSHPEAAGDSPIRVAIFDVAKWVAEVVGRVK
jgi:hypothetical protein